MALKITKQLDKLHSLFFKAHRKSGGLVRAGYCINKGAEDLETSNFSKFKVFRDEDSTVILDIEQERQQIKKGPDSQKSIYENLNLERGKTGVFEIYELVDILKKDNAKDLFVCEVPQSIKYVDYMCIVTGNSFRHMSGMANYVRRIYKMKRNPTTDVIPKIEGENCKNWMALDLGNIALHIFSQSAREKYDLESLWTLGAEFDPQSNKRNSLFELYEQHSAYLTSPQQAREFKDTLK